MRRIAVHRDESGRKLSTISQLETFNRPDTSTLLPPTPQTSLSCRPLYTTERLTKRRDDSDATSVENSPPHAAFSTCNQLRSSPPPLQDAPRKPEELVR